MKLFIYSYLLLTFLSLLSGCISLSKGEIIQSNISNNKENFKIVKNISGTATATYILGIGGNLKNGLINDAKKNMYSSYVIKPNQNITNITTDIKKTYFFIPIIYMTETAIVSADVIEFYGNDENINYQIIPETPKEVPQSFELKDWKSENIEIFNDSTICTPYKSISDVKVGDNILILNPKSILINGIVTKILYRKNTIGYKYLQNTGNYNNDEAEIQSIRKVN
jgi:hypothetical protein